MPALFPNTALASMTLGSDVYTYAQAEEGFLIEALGRLENGDNTSDTYSYSHQSNIGLTIRFRNGEVTETAPKLFTPLAANPLRQDRVGNFPSW